VSVALTVVLGVLLAVAILALIARLSPVSPVELWGLDPRRRAQQRIAAEADDMRDLLELENRRRRSAGRDEVTEDELRYGPGSSG